MKEGIDKILSTFSAVYAILRIRETGSWVDMCALQIFIIIIITIIIIIIICPQ